jgi:hypothetical protein
MQRLVEVGRPDQVERLLGLGAVVVLARRVAPAVVGKKEGRREPLVAVRRSPDPVTPPLVFVCQEMVLPLFHM